MAKTKESEKRKNEQLDKYISDQKHKFKFVQTRLCETGLETNYHIVRFLHLIHGGRKTTKQSKKKSFFLIILFFILPLELLIFVLFF